MEPPPVTQYTRYTVTPRRSPTPLWVRVLKWTLMVIVVFAATTVGMAFGYLQRTVAQLKLNDPVTVTKVKQQLTATSTGSPVNILVLGSDRRNNLGAGDTGRSDTLLLLRIDPRTKSISMLSVPRDLRVDIPGYGTDRINAAYSAGGAPLAVKTFKAVTGLSINHFIDVNFVGFVDIVDYLGGVYVDVDRRYYNNTAYTGYASIDLQAGYQRLNGHDALSFVRFRHDQLGDWGRIVRQQLFLRELKRQAFRWGNITKIPRLLKIVSHNTVSDISSIKELLSLTQLVLGVNTSHIYQTHVTGTPIVVGGADELQASPTEIAAVVDQFLHPARPPVQAGQAKPQPKRSFVVSVVNGGAPAGSAASIAAQLAAQGYRTTVVGNAPPSGSTATVVYATPGFVGNAHDLAAMLPPASVVTIPRSPGVESGVTIVAGPGFTGQLVLPQTQPTAQQIVYHSPHDIAQWHQLASSASIRLRMPTAWVAGTAYDWTQSRAYTLPKGHGRAAAAVVVGTTPGGGFWHIEELRWTNPPAIASPDGVKTVRGTPYMLFYNGAQLHMVAWKVGRMLYWVANSLDNELSNEAMMALATSFQPVK
jgi:LCP family protein required for cell wall assembly